MAVRISALPAATTLADADVIPAVEGGTTKKVPLSVLRAALFVLRGTGSPEGAVTADVGTLFLRSDGGASTTLYVKESGTGNTGWVAK